VLIKRRSEAAWRKARPGAFLGEDSLEALLARSPEILPGHGPGEPLLIIRQLPIGVNSADIVTVSLDGTIRVIECKLQSNPEVRRTVVGQLFAYASGLWRMEYDLFSAAAAGRLSGRSLIASMGEAAAGSGVQFSEAQFRDAVSASLRAGRFQLIIAVDSIKPELKDTVAYLNAHTLPEVLVLAMEVIHIEDGPEDNDIEILDAVLYGEEAILREGKQTPNTRWNKDDFLTALSEYVPDAAHRERIARIVEHAQEHPAFRSIYWGTGQYPNATASFNIGGKPVAIWSVWTGPNAVFSFNFEWMAGKVSDEALDEVVREMSQFPGVPTLYKDLKARQFKQRPSIPIASLFALDRAPQVINGQVDKCVAAPEPDPSYTSPT
jgi:hypothetical protein